METGDAQNGESLFSTATLDGVDCVTCHALPAGTNGQLTSAMLLGETQSIKIPQLRNMHEKTGFDATLTENNRGFGFIHDGSTPTMFEPSRPKINPRTGGVLTVRTRLIVARASNLS